MRKRPRVKVIETFFLISVMHQIKGETLRGCTIRLIIFSKTQTCEQYSKILHNIFEV